MKKLLLSFVLPLALFAALLEGCSSVSQATSALESGDEVSAVETLAKRLSKKSDDQKAADLFVSIYPSVVQKRIPSKTISDVRKTITSNVSQEYNVLRQLVSGVSDNYMLTNISQVYTVINEGENIVRALSDLVRIQNAVSTMPVVIGNGKKGTLYQITKFTDNFSGQYQIAATGMGEFYYNLGEAAFSGKTVERKMELLKYYKRAGELVPGIGKVSQRCAQLCYDIGTYFEADNTVESKMNALAWFTDANRYVNGFLDVSTKITKANYEIAMLKKPYASSIEDWEELVKYLRNAGSYSDAAMQLKDCNYEIAKLYKARGSYSDFETAGKMFAELGDYRNARNEADLFSFYSKLRSLPAESTSLTVRLSKGQGTPLTINKDVQPLTDKTARLTVTTTSSYLGAYTMNVEKVVYPGAMIEGASIADQRFSQFKSGKRNEIEVTISSSNGVLEKGVIRNTLDADETVKTIRSIAKRQANNITPTYTYEFYPVQSLEDLKQTTGVGADRTKASYAMESSRWYPQKSYTLVKVTQRYYTASIPAPASPLDFFSTTGASGTAPQAAALKDVQPYYVASVDYGRVGYFVVSSKLSSKEIIDDIVACRPRDRNNSGVSGMRVNPSISDKWLENNTIVSNITVSEKVYDINDIDGMYSWIKTGADMGVEIDDITPISFTLKNVLDNSYATLTQTTRSDITLP